MIPAKTKVRAIQSYFSCLKAEIKNFIYLGVSFVGFLDFLVISIGAKNLQIMKQKDTQINGIEGEKAN